VRLHAPDAGEADWLAFDAWLATTPEARTAYDEAATVWRLADLADKFDHDDDGDPAGRGRAGLGARSGSRLGRRAVLGLGGLGAALTAVLALVVLYRGPGAPTPALTSPPAQTLYAAGPGGKRLVALADGTRMTLAAGARASVSFDARTRRVSVDHGEVAFAVAHDAGPPFTVVVGDRLVRDIGTEFDVRRDGSKIRVAVREGRVEVGARGAAAAAPVALSAGQQLLHDEDTGRSSVSAASGEAFAWTQDRLIYRDQPLQVVVDELNRRFPHAVRIEGERAAAMRFTGVLAVDAEAATIRRLTELLPIEAERINGETILKARTQSR
jgi:transmembrane sensor